jgi:hypothetical protein
MSKDNPPISRGFLSSTKYCDLENPAIRSQTMLLISSSHGNKANAIRIFNWVRNDIKYAFDYWNVKASETIERMVGMCANKANLQTAMLRIAGIPAGYGVFRIRKEALKSIANEEIYAKSADVIIHVYCRVFLNGQWISADATVDKELFEVAYINVPGWDYGNWNGGDHFQMSSRYVVENTGTYANIDEFMDIPPRFLNDNIINEANRYIQNLRSDNLMSVELRA